MTEMEQSTALCLPWRFALDAQTLKACLKHSTTKVTPADQGMGQAFFDGIAGHQAWENCLGCSGILSDVVLEHLVRWALSLALLNCAVFLEILTRFQILLGKETQKWLQHISLWHSFVERPVCVCHEWSDGFTLWLTFSLSVQKSSHNSSHTQLHCTSVEA